MFQFGTNQDNTFAFMGANGVGTALTRLLMAEDIEPGSAPSYEICKQLLVFHPLGVVLTEEPLTLAQSQSREISVPVLGEPSIVEQFDKTWNTIGKVGATVVLHNLGTLSRTYGIASLGVGEMDKDLGSPLDLSKIADAELFFNVLDPLNTAGSLVLNQDPNSADFLKPVGNIRVNGKPWHHSRLFPKMHRQPLYIEYTNSGFGFVGQSIFQNVLYPMKSYIQTMITNDMVTKKAGLLVAKMESPGSMIDKVMQTMFGWKRGQIKSGVTGQVLGIGVGEEIETLNMQNLDKAFGAARSNVLRDIATGASMPASIVTKETLAEGFGEGSEDAKEKARYIGFIRTDMDPAYAFMDRIVQRQAWTPEFKESLHRDYPEIAKLPYDQWLYACIQAFTAAWPNYLIESDAEKSKTEDVKQKAAIATAEVLLPELDPANKAALIMWMADNVNEMQNLFSGRLVLDEDAMTEFFEENRQQAADAAAMQGEDTEPGESRPFAQAS
jgi:hypothetical protein